MISFTGCSFMGVWLSKQWMVGSDGFIRSGGCYGSLLGPESIDEVRQTEFVLEKIFQDEHEFREWCAGLEAVVNTPIAKTEVVVAEPSQQSQSMDVQVAPQNVGGGGTLTRDVHPRMVGGSGRG